MKSYRNQDFGSKCSVHDETRCIQSAKRGPSIMSAKPNLMAFF